jgi:hypothetical protein
MADLDEFRATHGRARGFIDEWNPHDGTLALLALIKLILSEYAAHLPLTCRQIFYRLVGKHGYPKSEKAYATLCQHLNNARRARYIDFDAIRDDGFSRSGALGYLDVAEFSRIWAARAERFTLDRQLGQTERLIVWCEARGMVPQLERVANTFGIEVFRDGLNKSI